jgi:hypothetical protein
MAEVLLTVSGTIAPSTAERIARGEQPRADYFELAGALSADLMDYAVARRATGFLGRLIERLCGPDILLAWACFVRRREYRTIFTDGEQIGIPLALLLKLTDLGASRPRHVMITHIISVGKKTLFLDLFGAQSHIDRFLCYARFQQRFIRERWNIAPERVIWTPFMVDADFFAPECAPDPATQALRRRPRAA